MTITKKSSASSLSQKPNKMINNHVTWDFVSDEDFGFVTATLFLPEWLLSSKLVEAVLGDDFSFLKEHNNKNVWIRNFVTRW